jgi:hypothetical protein
MRLIFKDGVTIELVNLHTNQGGVTGEERFCPASGLWAIPGGKIATTNQVVVFAMNNDVKVAA